MIIGIPKEIKIAESRVALIPDACAELVDAGHQVLIQKNAGISSGYPDHMYTEKGCEIASTLTEVYQKAELIIKVKEPQPDEYSLLNNQHTLFCYLHLAAEPKLQEALVISGCTAFAFENITNDQNELPLLIPMSRIAGTLAAQYASVLIHKHNKGCGILIGGEQGYDKGNVVVIGYGTAGSAAAKYFAKLGVNVTVIDKNEKKLHEATSLGENVNAVMSTPENIHREVIKAHILIGAVLLPAKKAPIVVSKETIKEMINGAVVIDIAVDQGGCIETTRPTSYEDPTYLEEGVVHFAVQNLPAAVPKTATQAISKEVLPIAKKISSGQWDNDKLVVSGLCIKAGRLL